MAKKAAAESKGNKSQAIRDALAAHPDKSPKEIADMLGEQGYKLNAQYVSTIKSNANRKAGAKFKVRRGRPAKAAGPRVGNGAAPMDAALAFIHAAGGFEQAKALMATVEQIKAAL